MKRIWNNFFVSFLNGIVILLPVAITVLIIRYLVIKLNQAILNPLLKIIALDMQGAEVFLAKGAILVFVIAVIALIGWGAKIFIINRVFAFGEGILLRVPIMGRIYRAVKQISSAFLGQGKTIFKQVVLVEYPRKGLYSLGFTTGISRGELRDSVGQSCINVFVPTTPNPTSGIFIVVPKDNIQFLKMSVEEGMKMVVSGGSVSPPYEADKEDE